MGRSTVVLSVRINKELKEKAESLNINIREVVEKALEEAIKQKERENVKTMAEKILVLARNVKEEDWTRDIRETRDER